jgi:transglutaminase-like putative cysteine protease
MRRTIKTLTAVSITAGLLLSVLIFVLVPRGIGMGQLGPMIRPTAGRVTGFADRVQLGQGGLISQSQATVLELRLHAGDTDQPLGRMGQIYYLRGAVLEQYRGGAWTRGAAGADGRDDAPEPGQRVRLDRDPRSVLPLVQTIEVREVARGETPIFAVYRPRLLSFRGQMSSPGRIAWDRRTWTVRREGEPGPLRYEVTSYPDPAAIDDGEAESRREGVSFPSERVADLAGSLLRSAGLEADPARRPISQDAQAARVFETHLRSRFSYTLDILAAPPGRDPTEWFLFEQRRGHCEYFASALAALCRSVGIDARVVTGYVAAEYDAARGAYVVRAANAHAWVEVYTGDGRWQTFDATPPSDLEAIHAARPGAFRAVGRWFDGVEDWWASSVVSFDSRTQARLWGVRPDRPSWLERVVPRRGGDEPQEETFTTRELAPAAAALAVAMAAALVVLGVIVLNRHLRKARPRAAGVPVEAARLLHEVSRELVRRGVARPMWQPPLDHAEAATRVLAEPGVVAREAVLEVYAYAFGPRDPKTLERARQAVTRLRRLPRSSPRAR